MKCNISKAVTPISLSYGSPHLRRLWSHSVEFLISLLVCLASVDQSIYSTKVKFPVKTLTFLDAMQYLQSEGGWLSSPDQLEGLSLTNP